MKNILKKKKYLSQINTIYDLVRLAVEVYKNKIAVKVNCDNTIKNITYEQLYCDIQKVIKVIPKDWRQENLVLLGTFDYDWLVMFLAVILSGNVAVPLDKNQQEIAELIHQCKAKAVYMDETVTEGIEKNSNIKIFRSLSFDDDSINIWEKRKEDTLYTNVNPNVSPDDIAVLIFTSGTTGKSKGVKLSHRNIIDNTKCGLYFIEDQVKTGDCTIPVLPPTHMLQIGVGILTPFYYGVAICIGGSMKYISNYMQMFKPKVLILVPMVVENMYDKVMIQVKKKIPQQKLDKIITISNMLRKVGIDIRRYLFKDILKAFGGNLECIICGGAALNPEVIEGFDNFGICVYEGYGITECSPILSCNKNKERKAGSVGVLCPPEYCEYSIIDGEICVRGSIVFSGYYNDEEATKEVLYDGWFHTGDFGKIDADGYLFITGRKKNLIILSDGNNVSPEEIEERFLDNTYIKSIFVNEQKYKGKKVITAHVYPNFEDFSSLSEENLHEVINQEIKKVNKTMVAYKRINRVVFYDTDFEKTALGKIKRYMYKEDMRDVG